MWQAIAVVLLLLCAAIFVLYWRLKRRYTLLHGDSDDDTQTTVLTGLDTDEQQLISSVLRFNDEVVKEVMTPRSSVVAVDRSVPFSVLLRIAIKNGYSRLPVYNGDLDHIAGVLTVKDLLPYIGKDDSFRWQKFVRAPHKVEEMQRIDDVLRDLQKKKTHIAIVVDEYGGTAGIVTIEDIIEEIVGEIHDEYDDEEPLYSRVNGNTYVFAGKVPLADFCEIMQLDEALFDDIRGDADTLAGLLLQLSDGMPAQGDKLKYGNYRFEIMEATSRRIEKVKVMLPKMKRKAYKTAMAGVALTMALVSTSCSKAEQTPEPVKYQQTAAELPFAFEYPTTAHYVNVEQHEDSLAVFFDIDFTDEKARLYATYREVPVPNALLPLYEESYRFIGENARGATSIDTQLYEAEERNVYAAVYYLQGNAPTPIQIEITDSTTYLLRASLLFNSGVYTDTKADTLAMLDGYITNLIETFERKRQ